MKKSCTVQTLVAVFSLLPMLAVAAPAAGQEAASKDTGKTVSWYADHQQERAQMQLRCLDDPGHLGTTPDCINAERGAIEAAHRRPRTGFGVMDPNNPAFWSEDPSTRAAKISMCRLNPQLDYCDAARRSLLIEAGKAKR
ncbi:hypothetical protein BVER_04474 [Candidatus Burkholderia verschuerenii]|uniref:Uncharacterized protein n=1 Tax=Candidatus Burkholderia verschuerenii TaxID=242163 RepID=A0A0L0MGU8_9BURK|nr:EexN family lipoprotein [Candidatus Burkholderia verschuerenii]KND61521.1 hypothetical protein BVER_04474 [Candidatus Burkholderia verschuerenii]